MGDMGFFLENLIVLNLYTLIACGVCLVGCLIEKLIIRLGIV